MPLSTFSFHRSARAWALLGSLVAAFSFPGESLRGQAVAGMVVEQVSLNPAGGALVTLFRAGGPEGELEPVAVTATDGEGIFLLEAPGPGTYRVQADHEGLASPLSGSMRLAAGEEVIDLALMVPSRLLFMAYGCQAGVPQDDASPGGAALVGVVRDTLAGVVVPNAWVTARWHDGGQARSLQASADASGRYVICGVPATAGTLRVQGQILGKLSSWDEVEIHGPSVVFHDVGLQLETLQSRHSTSVTQERILQEAAARTLGDMRGQLLDRMTDSPIPYAVVRLEGTGHQALTNEDGRFLFVGLQPGHYTLEIRHLGYDARSGEVEVPSGQDVFLRLRVAPRAVELEGIEVSARSAVREITRLTPFRRDIVYGEAMALEEERGALAFEILRRSSPGLQVRESYKEGIGREICVQTNRRVHRLRGGSSCENVQVILDGVRIGDGADVLLRTPAAEIESMEFLPPSHAQIMYGTGGNTANGVVIVYTRGKGPYASPLRNRMP